LLPNAGGGGVATEKALPFLTNAIGQLRVAELKDVCRAAGLRHSANKTALVARVLQACAEGDTRCIEAVRRAIARPADLHPRPPPTQPLRAEADTRCVCERNEHIGAMVQCDECHMWQHGHCVGVALHGGGPDSYTCERCRAALLDPFLPPVRKAPASRDANEAVLRSWYLPGSNPRKVAGFEPPQKHVFNFHISPQQWQEHFGVLQKPLGRKLSLRSFIANAAGKRNHRWPLHSQITLNRVRLAHEQQPQSWDGVSSKDKNEDRPLALSPAELRVGENELVIESRDPCRHLLVLVFVEPRSLGAVLADVLANPLSMDDALQHVRSIFGEQDDDDELTAGAARLGLQCPLTHLRLRTPVRSVRCKHLECFDLQPYLQMAKAARFPKYLCPRCSAHARPHELRVDPWMKQLLAIVPADVLEVEVEADGSFKAADEKQVPSRKRKRVESVEIDIGLDEDNPICLDD